MSKTRFQIPGISNSLSLGNLQQILIIAFQNLVAQLNSWNWSSDSANQNVDMATQRITNLGDPATGKDAVNRDYVTKVIGTLSLMGGTTGVNTTQVTVAATIQIAER